VAIRDWHGGKLVLLWTLAAGLWPALWALLPTYNFVIAGINTNLILRHGPGARLIPNGYTDLQVTLLWLAVGAMPVGIVTWRWLSGREGRSGSPREEDDGR